MKLSKSKKKGKGIVHCICSHCKRQVTRRSSLAILSKLKGDGYPMGRTPESRTGKRKIITACGPAPRLCRNRIVCNETAGVANA